MMGERLDNVLMINSIANMRSMNRSLLMSVVPWPTVVKS